MTGIKRLTDVEAVRLRPKMYLGPTDQEGLHNMVCAVVERSLAEVTLGSCTSIEVLLHADNGVTVLDNGLGPSTELDPRAQVPVCERMLTNLFAGRPDVNDIRDSIGLAIVNFLSEHFELDIQRNGLRWTQRFLRGAKATELTREGRTEERGTRIYFKPDPVIFHEARCDLERLATQVQELAARYHGLSVSVRRLAD